MKSDAAGWRLHVIGSGCPTPVAERYGSAFVLEAGGERLMIDCGPGTTYKMARMGLRPTTVHRVFLTHHHFDHTVDLPCFTLSRWDHCTGGEPPLRVYGPEPTRRFVDLLLGAEGAFGPDWRSRIEHPASHACHTGRGGALPRPGPVVEAWDVGPGEVARSAGWTVTAERVHHVEPGLESLAYRVESEHGGVVFAGDCGDCPELRRFARGADTLVVACTYFARTGLEPALTDVITGTREAAAIAAEAGVRKVVLTHGSPNFARPGVRDRAVAEVARSFGGAVTFPDELTPLDLTTLV
jgi:ribonuclease Z